MSWLFVHSNWLGHAGETGPINICLQLPTFPFRPPGQVQPHFRGICLWTSGANNWYRLMEFLQAKLHIIGGRTTRLGRSMRVILRLGWSTYAYHTVSAHDADKHSSLSLPRFPRLSCFPSPSPHRGCNLSVASDCQQSSTDQRIGYFSWLPAFHWFSLFSASNLDLDA